MPLGDKLGKPFGLLSKLGKKNKEDETSDANRHSSSHHASRYSSHASSASRHRSHGTQQAYYPSVTYERITPGSNDSRPPPAPKAPSPAEVTVRYESQQAQAFPTSSFPHANDSHSNHSSPNVFPSPQQVYYGNNASPMDPMAQQSQSKLPPVAETPLRRHMDSPDYTNLRRRQDGQFPSPSTDSSHSSLRSPNFPTPNGAVDTRNSGLENRNGGTPGYHSDGSTPFSVVMEEWMSQLRTPTPDVTLLPSPFDFNKDTPTPLDRADDIRRIQEALMPTPEDRNRQPPPNLKTPPPNGRPLVDDIASLCHDLLSQNITQPQANYGRNFADIKRELAPPSPSVSDTSSSNMSFPRSGKGKRRKMCTAEGCTNLSRSRGLCKAHGGGRRCSVDGCTRASQSGSLCITHGGGKRCTVPGCEKAAQSRGMCKAHGGGVRCRVEGCTKSSQGDGFCRTHGGGRRCGHPSGCTKWAQRNGMCMAHSEGKYGNSYRGRLHRMQGSVKQEES